MTLNDRMIDFINKLESNNEQFLLDLDSKYKEFCENQNNHTPTTHPCCNLGTKKINKWGNSLGVLLPKNVLTSLNIEQDDQIDFIFENGRIYLEKASSLNIPHYSLSALMAEYNTEQEEQE